MSRVIQDSDDELEGSPSPLKEQELPSDGMTDKATSSSEILLRGIHAAQDALAAAGTCPMMDGAADARRRSTSVQTASSKRKKTVRTYESSSKRSKTVAYDSHSRVGTANAVDLNQTSSRNVEWLTSTLKPDFAAHEPNVMFSETSSTIPDNTMTQQRIIQEAIEESRPGEGTSTQNKSDHTQNSDSSIPWSTYKDAHQGISPPSHASERVVTPAPLSQPVSSPKRHSQTHVLNRSSQTHFHTSHDEHAIDERVSPTIAPVPSPKIRRTEDSVSSRQPDAPKLASLLSEIEAEDLRVGHPIVNDRENSKQKRQKTCSVSPRERELISDESWIGIPKEQYKPRASRSRSAKVSDEQYLQDVQSTLKPKPKRRVTTHEEPEHPDRPIKATDSVDGVPATITQVQRASANTGPQPANVMRGEEPDLSQEVADQNKENETPGTKSPPSSAKRPGPPSRPVLVEVAIPLSASSSSKRKSSAVPENLAVKGAIIETPTLEPSPKPRPSSSRKKAKPQRSKTAVTPGFSQRRKVFDSDDSDSDISPVKVFGSEKDQVSIALAVKATGENREMPPPPSLAKAAEKNAGRGRPLKDDKAPRDSAPCAAEPNEAARPVRVELVGEYEELPTMEEAVQLENDHDELVKNSATRKRLALEIAEQLKTKKSTPPASTPEQISKPAESLPKTPEVKAKAKGAMSHSPLNKGKVGYRVGLSRSTRIAPLLKIMRK